jgi:hypothetical protein
MEDTCAPKDEVLFRRITEPLGTVAVSVADALVRSRQRQMSAAGQTMREPQAWLWRV